MIDAILALKSGGPNNYDILSQLYQRIFNFLIFKNRSLIMEDEDLMKDIHEDSSLISSMEKEVAAALESVIPRAALSPFIMLNNTEKVTQLTELTNLVLGIRLFNKEIGKGGSTIQDIGTLIARMDTEFLDRIRDSMQNAVKMTKIFTNYFESCLQNGGQLEKTEAHEHLKTELIYLRQFTSLLMGLMEKVEASVAISESSEGRYLKEVSDLKNLLGSKSSAPKEQVYPKFAILANSYLTLLEESRHSDDKINLFELLQSSFDTMTFTLDEEQQQQAEDYEQLQFEKEQQEEEVSEEEVISQNNVVYIEPKHTPEFLQIPLDILGFCLVTLVDHEGLLIQGKHSFGVFKYREESFVFRSIEEAKKFIKNPKHYIDSFYLLCRKIPELILLLRVEDHFKERGLKLIHIDPEQKGQATKIMLDFQGETPVHFDKFIDHNYCWNEWELRRKAIQMANIRNMTTKGTQTADSIYKIENQTQVWLMKDACSQTGINSGNNPIRPRNYITDLRDKSNQ